MTEHTDFMESRMLYAYLDGELDGAHEEALFRMLSDDSALRAEMQDQLTIRKAVQHDSQAYTPPAAVTAAIFSTLGFSIPSTAEAATLGGAGRVWFASGSALLAVVTSLLLSTLFPGANDATLASAGVTDKPAIVLHVEDAQALPDVPSATKHRPVETATVTEAHDAAAAAVVIPVEVSAEVASDIPASQPQRSDDIACLPPFAFQAGGEPDLRGVRAPFIPFVNLLRIPVDGMMLYARNSSTNATPSSTIESGSGFPLTDVNIGALLPLSSYHAVGIEIGRETFPQIFSGMLRGAAVRYEQSPVAYCAMAVYQINAGELLPYIVPFAQIQAGAAYKLGPLARATMGLAIRPFDRVSLLVGAEGSVLAYKFQDKWFDTKKLGLTYGLSYEF